MKKLKSLLLILSIVLLSGGAAFSVLNASGEKSDCTTEEKKGCCPGKEKSTE